MGEQPSLWWRIVDRVDHALTYARSAILDWLAPMPETPVDPAIRQEGEREPERARRAASKVLHKTKRTMNAGPHGSMSKSDFIALFAALVALFSFGFAIYQWDRSSRDEEIRAAIDLSTHYIDNRVDASILFNQYLAGNANAEDMMRATSQLGRTEYAAALINHGKIARDYVSEMIICDIVNLPITKTKLGANSVLDEEAEKFIRLEPKACPNGNLK